MSRRILAIATTARITIATQKMMSVGSAQKRSERLSPEPSRPVRILPVAHASKDQPGHQQTHAEDREDPDTAMPGSAGPPRRAGRRRLARGGHRLSDSPASWMKWIAVSPKVFARKISRPAG